MTFLALLLLIVAVLFIVWVLHPKSITVKACQCGAHWWIRRWYFFWRHLDASPFNDKLQNRWTIWTFEFRQVLKISAREQAEMGYPMGPYAPHIDLNGSVVLTRRKMFRGRPLWAKSKWQLSPRSESYCVRCMLLRS